MLRVLNDESSGDLVRALIGAYCAWLSPKVQGKRDARPGQAAGSLWKLKENKALRGFPGGA
jgi:hypothetical protein